MSDEDWSDEAIIELRKLWGTPGISTAEIGRRMGRSKSSIVGKAHRLELPTKGSPIRRSATGGASPPATPRRITGSTLPPLPTASAPAPPAVVVPSVPRPHAPSPPVADPAPPAPQPSDPPQAAPAVRPEPGSRNACCWPFDRGRAVHYCGELVLAGKSYCAEHHAISTLSPREMARETVPLDTIEQYAANHRVVVPIASGLTGLIVAVNNHRRAAKLIPYALKAKAAA